MSKSLVKELFKHEHLWWMCEFNLFCSNMFLWISCIIFSAQPQNHYVDRSINLFYLSPTGTSHCSGNGRQVVCAEKQNTRCLQMNIAIKWTLFKETMTGRQTSGSNSPLYTGLAVLRLFLSCRLLWISDRNENTICDGTLKPNISHWILFLVFAC